MFFFILIVFFGGRGYNMNCFEKLGAGLYIYIEFFV